jgi:hypothetical protein
MFDLGGMMAKKQRHSVSGRTRSQRREHDRQARAQEASLGRPWHASPAIRYAFIVLAFVVVLTLTLLFVGGVIKW